MPTSSSTDRQDWVEDHTSSLSTRDCLDATTNNLLIILISQTNRDLLHLRSQTPDIIAHDK